jgi:hypothetical protein
VTGPISTWSTKAAVVGWCLVAALLLVAVVLREVERRKKKPEIRLGPSRSPRMLSVAHLYRAARMGERRGYDL